MTARLAVPAALAIALATPAAAQESGTLVVANMADHTASIIDVASRRTLVTLPTGQGPHEVAVTRDGRTAVVSNYGVRGAPGSTLTVLDLANPGATRVIGLEGCQRPHSAAFLPGDSLLAVTCEASQAVAVVHVGRGTVSRTVPTNQAVSHMLAVTADGRRGYTANILPGTVTEVDLGSGGAAPRVFSVAPRVEGIAVTPGGEEVWVGSNQAQTVSVVDARTGAVVNTLEGFGMPYRIAITPDGRTAVIADPPGALVWLVDVATRRTLARIAIPADGVLETAEFPGSPSPEGIALSGDGRMAYVALQGSSRVAAIDLARRAVTGYMDTGRGPDGIGYSPLAR